MLSYDLVKALYQAPLAPTRGKEGELAMRGVVEMRTRIHVIGLMLHEVCLASPTFKM